MKTIIRKYWHILVLICLSLTPVLWFLGKGDVIINGVDTNFPLDPLVWFQRRFFVWNTASNGGGDFSSSTAGIFFHFIQVVPYLLGVSLQFTEMFSMVFWFATIATAAYFFSRALVPKDKVAQLVFVIFYCFNTYLFNTWENVKVSNLALIATLPWFLGNLMLFHQKRIGFKNLLLNFVLGSILATGTGINPAYFITLIIGVCLYLLIHCLFSRQITKDTIKAGVAFFIILFLVNAFWVLPTANFLLFSHNRIQTLSDIGFTDWVDSLSKNTSLVNVLRMQGAWDWYSFDMITRAPLYLPYVVNFFYKFPFVVYSFLIPAVAIAGFVFRSKKNKEYYILCALFLIIGIFLGAGTHDPTGALYKLFLAKLPFFSFFRSPWYIFTPFVMFAYASLLALLFNSLRTIVAQKTFPYKKIVKNLLAAGIFIFVISNFLYTYPLVTGKIFRPSRSDGFFIKFPPYVWETKNMLKDRESFPRIIGYPNEGLESFLWGYKGVDSILGLFSDNEILSSSSISHNSGLSQLLAGFYELMQLEKYKSALAMLPILGADTIFYKNDTASLTPKITSKLQELTDVTKIGEWSFFKDRSISIKKIASPSHVYLTGSNIAEAYPGVVDLVEKDATILNSSDTVIEKIQQVNTLFDSQRLLFTKGVNTTYKQSPNAQQQVYSIEVVRESNYSLGVEKHGISGELSIALDSQQKRLTPSRETDSLYVFGPFHLQAGKYSVTVYYPDGANLFNIENLGQFSTTAGLRSSDLPTNAQDTLIAFNDGVDAKSIYLPIEAFDPSLTYNFSFDYKYEYGSVPIFEILQFTDQSPIKTFPVYPGGAMDWETRSTLVEPINTQSKMTVHLTMPKSPNSARSKALLQNLSFKPTYTNDVYLVEEVAPKNKIKDIPNVKIISENPSEYILEIENGDKGYFLTFADGYNPDWKLQSASFTTAAYHFTANGYANGWYVLPGAPAKHKVKIMYEPQKLYQLGRILSLLTIVSVVTFSVFYTQKWQKRS